MAWLCTNKDHTENICNDRPKKCDKYGYWEDLTSVEGETVDSIIELPKGSIEKLIGKKLTWDDQPVEIK